jgi:hypothetical protein
VVANRLRVPGPDPDLVVEGLRRVVPHPQQPVRSELRFVGEVRGRRAGAHLVRELAYAVQEQRRRIAEGLHALDVVARVPPTARRVDAHTERVEVVGEAPSRVRVRRQVRHRVLVVEMRRRGAECVRDVVRAVTLGLVEGQRVGERVAVDVLPGVDPEAG